MSIMLALIWKDCLAHVFH